MKMAYFDCFSGVSGDMVLGSLVDLGLGSSLLTQELEKLSLPAYRISCKKVLRGGITGTKVDVIPSQQSSRSYGFTELCKVIEDSSLSEEVRVESLRVLRRLGEAEAKVHGTSLEEVHFHEIGAVDTVVDIVGSVFGLGSLGIEEVFFSPLPMGRGYVNCEHGQLPVPAPITLELLRGYRLVTGLADGELTTPTGAAILTTLGKQVETCPDITLEGTGYGAGTRDNPSTPNLLRVLLGELSPEAQRDEIWVVETNVDDMTGEVCGYVMDKLFQAGAVDVYTTPIQMKKNRPGILLTALVPEGAKTAVEEVFFRETTTFGIRSYKAGRKKLTRQPMEVKTRYGTVKVKVGRLNGMIKIIAPEYEDCKRVAEEKGIPLRLVYEAAWEATKEL